MAMSRRELIWTGALSAAGAMTVAASGQIAGIPIIDPHMHLFDATRPQGAVYTGSKFYKGGVSTTAMYVPQARAAGIVG